jgi:hypothetical protein
VETRETDTGDVAFVSGYGRGEPLARGIKARPTENQSPLRDHSRALWGEPDLGAGKMEQMTDPFTRVTEYENLPKQLWADRYTVRVVADGIRELEGWPE